MQTKHIMASDLKMGHKIFINNKIKTVVEMNWTHVYIRDTDTLFGERSSLFRDNDLVDLILL